MKQRQISKKKIKERLKRLHEQEKQETLETFSLPGQPNPLEISFEELRKRAMDAPKLKAFKEDDVDLHHCKLIDYNSSFALAIILLCFLEDGKFFWKVQTCFVSKSRGKQASLSLLNKRNIAALNEAKVWALGDCGDSTVFKKQIATGFVWDIPFSESDYEKLDVSFRELVNGQ